MNELTERLARLKPRERKFVLEMRAHGKQGAAARAAGYPVKSADVTASRLMQREDIQAVIKLMYEEDCKALCITPDSLILHAYEIYSRCMQAEPVMIYDADAREWVESGQWKFDSKGAARSLEIIADVAGLKKSAVELDAGDFSVNIKVVE